MKGVAVRGVNVGDVRVLQVGVPPIEEQKEIVHRVDASLNSLTRSKSGSSIDVSRGRYSTELRHS